MRGLALAAMALLVAILPVAAADSVAPPGWQSLVNARFAFSVTIPEGHVRTQVEPAASVNAPTANTFGIDRIRDMFSVKVIDFPVGNGIAPPDAGAVLSQIMKSGSKDDRIVSQTPFDMPGGAGEEIVLEGQSYVMRGRIYVMGARVYEVTAGARDTGDPEILRAGDYAQFFDSFRILPK